MGKWDRNNYTDYTQPTNEPTVSKWATQPATVETLQPVAPIDYTYQPYQPSPTDIGNQFINAERQTYNAPSAPTVTEA